MSDGQWSPHAAPRVNPPQAPPPRRTKRYVIAALGAVLLLALGFVAGLAVRVGTADSTARAVEVRPSNRASTAPTQDPEAEATSEYTPAATESTYPEPTAKDFKLTVKTLGKQCFGSAGCNVRYRILVAYSGAELDPSISYDVVYEVRGGEDGPVTNTLTVTGNTSSVEEEESVSTKNRSAKLSVVVADVLGH